jgi:hypothetical protein
MRDCDFTLLGIVIYADKRLALLHVEWQAQILNAGFWDEALRTWATPQSPYRGQQRPDNMVGSVFNQLTLQV